MCCEASEGSWAKAVSQQIFVIPAIIGTFALLVLAVDAMKTFQSAEEHAMEEAEQAGKARRPTAAAQPSPATR